MKSESSVNREVYVNYELERDRLNEIANDFSYEAGVNGLMIEYSASVFYPWFTGNRALELGPAEGGLTSHLVRHFNQLEVVEASARFASHLRTRFPFITVHEQLFENFCPISNSFDTVVLGHVLEHVEDPHELLLRARNWIGSTGRVLAATPNGNSLHRRLGVDLGLLSAPTDLNESDIRIGHRRVYTPESLTKEFLDAGFQIESTGGFFLKILSNAQLEKSCSREAIWAMMSLGRSFPEVAAETYVIARKDT